MRNLLEIESDFLSSREVRGHLNLSRIDALAQDIKDKRKSQFETSLKYAKLVNVGFEWFKSDEGQRQFQDNGITWSTEDFYKKALGISKAHFYRVMKVAKIQVESPEIVTQYKRECTQAENNGETVERSVAELIKISNGTSTGGNTTSQSETMISFSIKKGIMGNKGKSIRYLTTGEMKECNTAFSGVADSTIAELYRVLAKMSQQLRND